MAAGKPQRRPGLVTKRDGEAAPSWARDEHRDEAVQPSTSSYA